MATQQQPLPPVLLWVDLRRAPVAVIPSAVRRVLKATEAVGKVSEGLVVQWAGGARGAGGEDAEDDRDHGGGGRGRGWGGRGGRGKVASAGRRGTVLEAFARVEPALEVTEPSNSRGQVRNGK